MVKQVTGVAADTSSINLDTFNDITVKTMEVQTADISSLNIAEDVIIGGRLEANDADFNFIKAGFIQFKDNVISLTTDATTDELILQAPKITLQSESAALTNLTKISTEELEIKDSVITIGLLNTISSSDRGIHFKYINAGEYKDGFFGYCPTVGERTEKFTMLTGVTMTNNTIYTDNGRSGTLGDLELRKLYIRNISFFQRLIVNNILTTAR